MSDETTAGNRRNGMPPPPYYFQPPGYQQFDAMNAQCSHGENHHPGYFPPGQYQQLAYPYRERAFPYGGKTAYPNEGYEGPYEKLKEEVVANPIPFVPMRAQPVYSFPAIRQPYSCQGVNRDEDLLQDQLKNLGIDPEGPPYSVGQNLAIDDSFTQARHNMIGSKYQLGDTVYIIKDLLKSSGSGPSIMNDGIRVLENPSGVLVVQKVLKMNTPHRRLRAEAEKKALKQIAKAGGSLNINKLYEAIWEVGSAQSSLVLEYCNRGSMDAVIDHYTAIETPIPEHFCIKVLYELAAALCMCHLGIRDPKNPHEKIENWNTICHLDIKPGNVFLQYDGPTCLEGLPFIWPHVVLGDFGCNVTRDDIMSRKIDHRCQPYGTRYWFPPESDNGVNGMGTIGTYGKFTDIWQMGGVVQGMCRLICSPDMWLVSQGLPAGKGYSPNLNLALMKCMAPDFNLRPSALEVATGVKWLMDRGDW